MTAPCPDNGQSRDVGPTEEAAVGVTDFYTTEELRALGWKRPDVFPHIWAELGLCFSVAMSMCMAVKLPVLCLHPPPD